MTEIGTKTLSKLASVPSSIRHKLNSERFLRKYGKNILKIESLFVLIAVSTFALQFFLPAGIFLITFVTWFVAFASTILFHQFMFSRIGKREICPYEILRQIHVRSFFIRSVLLSIPIFFATVYIWSNLLVEKVPPDFPFGLLLQLILKTATIFYVIVIFFLVIAPLAVTAYFLSFVPLQNNRITRLTFRTVLVGLALIRKDETHVERERLVKKHIKWFRYGLRSYNKYLYETNPARLQIVNTDDYYSNLCSVASIGNLKEQTIILEQFRVALRSVQGRFVEDDPRHLLVALKNLHDVRRKKDYPSDQLYGMLRPKSLLEKARDYLSHPVFKGLIVFVPIIAAIVSVLSNLHMI